MSPPRAHPLRRALDSPLTHRLALALALAFVAVAFVLPIGNLFARSFVVREVVTKDGRVIPAVGDVQVTPDRVIMAYQAEPGGKRVAPAIRPADVVEVRNRLSLRHYAFVFGDPRAIGLVKNSLTLAVLGSLAALLLGLPIAWLLFRTDLPGRRVLLVLCLAPAILPPFLVAMGGARRLMNFLTDAFGLTGAGLQIASSTVIFGFVLFPLVVVLVGRALAAVPVGAWEAARLLGGRGAALRRIVGPAVLPAVFGATALAFVLAWSDFSVPDLLSFLLPPSSQTHALHTFPTEVFSQWDQHEVPRAVATGGPFVLVTGVLLLLSIFFLRRSPVVGGGEDDRRRPPARLSRAGQVAGWLGILAVLVLSVAVPLADMAGWARGRGESVARSVEAPEVSATSRKGELFDVIGALDRTQGGYDDLLRWLRTGVTAALLATAVAVVLARWALRGNSRWARGIVFTIGLAPLAVPGLVYSVATKTFWIRVGGAGLDLTVLPSAFALAARFLPFALLAAWVVLRQVRRGQEEAAALLGAGAGTRALRIWWPPAAWGIAGGALAVLVLALREIDTVVTIDTRVLPLRIYENIHYSRLADEANLSFLYVGILLIPALLAALAWSRPWQRRRMPGDRPGRS